MKPTLKHFTSLSIAVALLVSTFPVTPAAAEGEYWKTGQATVDLASVGNLTASGSASEEVPYEIVSIDSVQSDTGGMNASFSGRTISATWTGGTKTTTETWLPATSNTYYGADNSDATWTKKLPQATVRNVEAFVTPQGSATVSGNVITYKGWGAENTNTNWNYQSVTASAVDGKSDAQTAGYGVKADRYERQDYGISGDVKKREHSYNDVHVYAKVVANDPVRDSKGVIGKHTAASAFTAARFQKFYYMYLANATYEYLAPAGTYNYSGTVTYTYKYQADPGTPIVSVKNDAPVPLYRGTKVTFTGTANDTKGKIVSQEWTGVTSGSGSTATFTPTKLGTHTATFTATNDAGAKGSASSSVTVVNKPPRASITASKNQVHRGEQITLKGYANDDDGEIVSTNWSGGVTGTGYTKTFTPDRLGTYKIEFKVKDNDGATAMATTTIQVGNQSPKVKVVSPSGSADEPKSYGGKLIWSFEDPDGDPQTSYRVQIFNGAAVVEDSGQIMSYVNTYNPSMGFDPDNVYSWKVTVTDPWGGTDTSLRGYFRVKGKVNYAITGIHASAQMEQVSKNPVVQAFIVGKYGPPSFNVNVSVRKTAGNEDAAHLNLTLKRTGYGKTWTTSRYVKVDYDGQTVSFTVPNIPDADIRNWQASKGNRVTLYQPFKLEAILSAAEDESYTADNQAETSLRTAEYGRSQLTH